jgi:capsular exopolysaccharide synthesis family protein
MENNDFDNEKNNSEVIIIKELFNITLKNWKWFALSVFLFAGIGVFYLMTKNPIFDVDALVLLKEDDKRSGSSSSTMSMISSLGDLGSMMGSKNIDNEVVVFNTRKIMKKSITDLNMYVALEVHDKLRKINPYPTPPFNITVDPLQADTIGFLEFTMNPAKNDTYKIKGKYYGKDGVTKFATTVNAFPSTIQTPSLDVHIAKNPLIDEEKNPKRIDVRIFNPNTLSILLNRQINVEATSKKTTIIRLSTQTDNVKWAQDLLNKLIESFNKDAIEDKNMIAYLTSGFVNERLLTIEEELGSVEKQVEKYKQENNLTDISSEAKLFLEQMGSYDKARIEAQIQLSMILYVKNYVKDATNRYSLIPSIGIKDESLVKVIAGYNETLAERNRLESTSTASNPALQLMDAQLVSLRQNISGNIDNVAQSMEITIKDLKKQDLLTNSKIKAIPRQEREYIEIRRQQEIKAELYSFLLQKREETNLNLASTTPKAKIIDEPMPGLLPVSPKKTIILLIFFCLGVGVPFFYFYLRKLLKVEINSIEELGALSEVEIIGEICKNFTNEKVVVQSGKTNPSIELFRLLRANLSFALDGQDKKVILLTSNISGEGKTYISVNLATSLALLDKKVLLVGLDIRNPQIGQYLKNTTAYGVTNYISDTGIKTSDIVQHSNIHSNMDIIYAGPVPPNPNELLMNARLDKLFKDLRDIYDYIILDTAPVGLVSDTFLLDRLADACLYIVKIGLTHKSSIKYLNTIHKQKKLKNLHVIANGVDIREKNRYGYGYGDYGYGYGKGKI